MWATFNIEHFLNFDRAMCEQYINESVSTSSVLSEGRNGQRQLSTAHQEGARHKTKPSSLKEIG